MKRAILFAIAVLLIIANYVVAEKGDDSKEIRYETEIKPIYFILGCLDHYPGRALTEKDSVVQSFYSSEVYASQIFEHYLNRFIKEESISTIIQKKISDGGHIIFLSPEIYQTIIGIYPVSSSLNFIKEQSKEAKLSYLAGVYARHGNRYGDEDDFSFLFSSQYPKAWQKASVVAELLKEFSCKNVQIENLNNPGYVGASSLLVTFVPSPEIIKLFQTVSKQLNGKERINRWVTN